MNTIKGPGIAHFLIDEGIEADILFVVFLNENGQIWTFKAKDVRAIKNVTAGRTEIDNLIKEVLK